MCGFVGAFSAGSDIEEIKKSTLLGMKSINHRGPDAQGTYFVQGEKKAIGMGHVRLSIIDLDERSNQPMISTDSRYILVFNGEIYNFLDLKVQLQKEGVVFRTKSDTEVILNGYIKWGVSLFDQLDGIFSIAIFDKADEKLILVRDHFGIKPLYYFLDNNNIAFASEIKALIHYSFIETGIDENAIAEFLLNSWLYEPDTGFKNIKKVEPGTYMIIGEDAVITKKYWLLDNNKNISNESIVNYTESEIKKSVQNQLMSDVDLAVLFSGGVDSSLIAVDIDNSYTGIIAKYSDEAINTSGFTNDYYYGKEIAKYTKMNLETIHLDVDSKNQLLTNINFIVERTEELIADYTFMPTFKICNEAHKKGYTVLLSGMGADELYTGYSRYRAIKYSVILPLFKIGSFVLRLFKTNRGKFGRLKRNIERLAVFDKKNLALSYGALIGFFSPNEIRSMLTVGKDTDVFEEYNKKFYKIFNAEDYNFSMLKKIMYTDLFGCLSHNLTVADKASMAASTELRVPLVTKKMAEIAFSIDDKEHINIRDQKILLKKILKKRIPAKYVDRSKAGFNPPVNGIISNLTKEELRELVVDNTYLNKYISGDELKKIVEDHVTSKKENSNKIMTLLFLSSWLNFSEQLLKTGGNNRG